MTAQESAAMGDSEEVERASWSEPWAAPRIRQGSVGFAARYDVLRSSGDEGRKEGKRASMVLCTAGVIVAFDTLHQSSVARRISKLTSGKG